MIVLLLVLIYEKEKGEGGRGGTEPILEGVWLQTGVLLGEPPAEYHPLCTQTMTFKGPPGFSST